MADLSYLAEGMPFEERCQKATELLRGHYNSLLEISGGSVDDVLDIARRYAGQRADIENPELRAMLTEQERDDKQRSIDFSTAMFELEWKQAQAMMTLFYGADAVEYAVKVILEQ